MTLTPCNVIDVFGVNQMWGEDCALPPRSLSWPFSFRVRVNRSRKLRC